MTEQKNRKEKRIKLPQIMRDIVLPCISLWLLLIGIRLGFVTAFDGWMKLRHYYLPFLGVAVFLTVFVVCGRARRVIISSILFFGGLGFYVWKHFAVMQQNVMVLAHYINKRYVAYTHRNLIERAYCRSDSLDKNSLLTLLCIVLVFCIALFAFRMRQELSGLAPVCLVFMAGLLFGKAPGKTAVTMMIFGCGIALVVMMTGKPERQVKKGVSLCERDGKMSGRLPGWLPAVCFLCISAAAGFAVSGRLETPAMKWAPNFQKTELAVEEQVIRTVTNLAQYVRGLTGFGGNGVLSNASPHYTNTQVMEVTVDFKPHAPIYLRGFTGETYKNGHWSEVDEKALETALPNEKVTIWRRNYEQMKQADTFLAFDDDELLMRASNTSLENIFITDLVERDSMRYRDSYANADIASYMRSGMENSIHSGILTLKYKGRERLKKSGYLPYNANLFGENGTGAVVKIGGDGNLQRRDSQYSVQFYLMSQKKQSDYVRWMDTIGEGMEDIVSDTPEESEWQEGDEAYEEGDEDETSYSNLGEIPLQERYQLYAREHYAQINDGDLPLYQELVEREYPVRDNSGVADTVYNIQKILWQNTSYSLDLKPVPMGQDYAEYFLFSQQKGYCEHYATAATILLREFNIPARYVSGYRIDNKVFKENEDGTYTAKVKDSDAHAWTETLQEYTGWTPWEVTPGDGGEDEESEPATFRTTSKPKKTLEPPNAVKRSMEINNQQTASPTPVGTVEPQESASPTAVAKADKPLHTGKKGTTHVSPAMVAAVAGGMLFVLVFLVLPIVFRIRQRRRRARILVAKEKPGKQAAGFCVAYLVDALRLAGEKLHKNAEEQAWMQILEREYKGVLTQAERRELLELAQVGTYSRSGASAVEQNRLWELCRKVLRRMPYHCRLPRRMVFRMIFKKE